MAEDTGDVLRLMVGQRTGELPAAQFEANPEAILEVLATLSLADVCAATFLWNLYESALRETRAGATPASVMRLLRKHANRRTFRGMARAIAHAILRDPQLGARFADVREALLPSLYDALARAVEEMDKEAKENRDLESHPFVRKMLDVFQNGSSEQNDAPSS